MVFVYANQAKLVLKWDQKSILTLKDENQLNASRLAFSWLSGVEVGSKNRSFFRYLLGSISRWILEDCWYQNGAKLVPQWDQKSMLTSKGEFSKKKNMIFSNLGGFWVAKRNQVGTNMGSKIDFIFEREF